MTLICSGAWIDPRAVVPGAIFDMSKNGTGFPDIFCTLYPRAEDMSKIWDQVFENAEDTSAIYHARPLPRIYALCFCLPLSIQPRLNLISTQQQGPPNSIYSWIGIAIYFDTCSRKHVRGKCSRQIITANDHSACSRYFCKMFTENIFAANYSRQNVGGKMFTAQKYISTVDSRFSIIKLVSYPFTQQLRHNHMVVCVAM